MRSLWALGAPPAAFLLALGALVIVGTPAPDSRAATAGLAPDAPMPDAYRALVIAAARHCAEADAPLLAAQLDAESGWDPDAVSPAGAEGLAQFTDDTWARWGRDADHDGRASPFDPADAIDAQARYLCFLFDDVADLPGNPVDVALAAYNAGPARVRTHGGIPELPETRAYIDTVNALLPRYRAAFSAGSPARDCAFSLTRDNPRTCQEAIDAARREARSGSGAWYRRCLAFVAESYGWAASGEPTARAAWDRMVRSGLAHRSDPRPPAGALLFYDSGDAGHVALHLGGGRVATNDIIASGHIDIVPLDDLTDGRWRLTYLGWAPPDFPHAAEGPSRVG
ncbi:lytic transglycosylase domain-containing protein [Streptomyces marincola]|nr:lytic transglycosylase domain-containing protein [Streptomyces marincola]